MNSMTEGEGLGAPRLCTLCLTAGTGGERPLKKYVQVSPLDLKPPADWTFCSELPAVCENLNSNSISRHPPFFLHICHLNNLDH